MKATCKICRQRADHTHHIVPRRITRCDDPENLIALCWRCHQNVHDHREDLMIHLTKEQQAKAVLLTGSIESARMLLCPSAYRTKVTA